MYLWAFIYRRGTVSTSNPSSVRVEAAGERGGGIYAELLFAASYESEGASEEDAPL